jgi:hypothetical protein
MQVQVGNENLTAVSSVNIQIIKFSPSKRELTKTESHRTDGDDIGFVVTEEDRLR